MRPPRIGLRPITLFLLLAILLSSPVKVGAQNPPPGEPDTAQTIDCSKYLHLQKPKTAYPSVETSSPPDLMPPHPDLAACAQLGLAPLPQVLTDRTLREKLGIEQPQAEASHPSGSFRTLAILVNFTDHPSQVNPTSFNTLLFGSSNGTLPDYYNKVSYGILDIVTVDLPSSLGWKTMPQPYTYYVGSGYGFNSSYPNNAQKLAEDAVIAANPIVNYANYDNDNDGYVDTVFIVHSGVGAEYSGNLTDIWSHSWNTVNSPHLDGKTIFSYTIEPEYWQTPGDMTVGVYAHELGHTFGLPDLYDTDYSSHGVGRWSLMAAGSWNGTGPGGNSPAFLDAWSRAYLGFSPVTEISANTNGVSIPQAETNAGIFRIRPAGGGASEYFLVENRQKTGYDTYIPGNGLLVWHIDEAKFSQGDDQECKQLNRWNCTSGVHYTVALEQADALLNLENNTYNNYGDTGDPFPGSTNKRTIAFSTTPNTSSYFTSSDTNLTIANISNAGVTMSADFGFGPSAPDFNKITPNNGTTVNTQNPTLLWGNSSGVTSYEYCVDTTNNTTCDLPSTWVSTGLNTSTTVLGLSNGVHYWQVRANNNQGVTYANTGTWWSFTVTPTSYKVYLPINFSPVPPCQFTNCDFELGPGGGWSQTSVAGRPLIVNSSSLPVIDPPITPHSGNWVGYMGGVDNETATLSHSITLPAGNPILTFFYWIESQDICDPDYDNANIKVGSTIVATIQLCMPGSTNGWNQYSLDMSSHAGSTITLQFVVTTDGVFISHFFVDDFSIETP